LFLLFFVFLDFLLYVFLPRIFLFNFSVLLGCSTPNTVKHERAGSAEVGPCLTDAAPKAAPGGLSVNDSRYAKVRTSTSAVAAACCSGGVINTSSTARVGRSTSIQAGEKMIIPLMLNVKKWVAAAAINRAT
jgi:hypothetical protein